MPGVPREMFRMWTEQVVPRLRVLQPRRFVQSTTVKTIGIGESAAEQLLHDLVAEEHPVVATYAKDDGVHIRVTVTGSDLEQATRLRDQTRDEVIRRLGGHVYGTDDVTLPGALGAALSGANLTVAIADVGGGGRFAAMLASEPGSALRISTAMMTTTSNPFTLSGRAHSVPESMPDANVTLGINVDLEPVGNSVFEGSITVALSGAIDVEERTLIRAGFEDAQRRSALVAADVLLRALRIYS